MSAIDQKTNQEMQVVALHNTQIRPTFILVCEHASNFIPARYNQLGLTKHVLKSHIAWDPGAFELAKNLSKLLNAPLIAQQVSRLIYDCNRPPDSPTAMPEISEIYEIEANKALSIEEKRHRVETYYIPFINMLDDILERQLEQGSLPIIVTIHSFTPTYHGNPREVEIGILHDDDSRFADDLLNVSAGDQTFIFRRNEPYGPKDGVTHSLKKHAISRRLKNVMLEVRNDLIANDESQKAMAELLAKYLNQAAQH